MTMSPELLAAYADGELDADTARGIEAEIAANPDLQAELAAHRALRARLAAHFAPITAQPVPDLLRQVLTGGDEANVVDFAVATQKRRTPGLTSRWIRIGVPALAASLILALVGMSSRASGDYAGGDLANTLDSQLTAIQKANAPVRVLLSFRDGEGEYCRGFASRNQSGIACRDSRGWRLHKLFEGSNGIVTDYRQAGSADEKVMAAMQDMAQGPALDAAAEAEAAGKGWRR